ncbi:hypothetical protein CW368_05415 [Actinomycetales bacterium SN12]|nr:hypothetical protein CW368_05415 [Actinomycetales bacterium SN12]
MDPILLLATELWWVAPTAAGAGATGYAIVRRRGTVNGRRLGYDAARHELRRAQLDARAAADAARIARADLARVVADRAAARADAAAVASARRALRDAQLSARAAVARVKASRVRVSTERSAMSSSGLLPLERLRARHDALLARWMEYETDPARAIAFPQMSDGRQPATATFLAALERGRDARPRPDGRVSAEDFATYRAAVEDLERAFDLAERAARGEQVHPELPDALWDAARTLAMRTSDTVIAWTARKRRQP